jgi:hypothetical protein
VYPPARKKIDLLRAIAAKGLDPEASYTSSVNRNAGEGGRIDDSLNLPLKLSEAIYSPEVTFLFLPSIASNEQDQRHAQANNDQQGHDV